MTSGDQERLGRVDDEAEAQEPSSTTEGAAAEGDHDPAPGSPGPDHPVGEDFPDEAVRYDDPDHPRREEPPQE